jgi:ferric-dicitrate binding protein FerR (iron transport regulator)
MTDSRRCPPGVALSREFSRRHEERAPTRLRRHIDVCVACRHKWAEWEELRELARALPVLSTAPAEQEQMRTALLLLSAPPRRPSPRRAGWVSLAIAAAAVLLLVAPRSTHQITRVSPTSKERAESIQTNQVRRGSVHPIGFAQFALEHSQPDEIVRLHEGSIVVDVDPLRPGERFRVVVGDAEIEVRGTSFNVVAIGDRLRRVEVLRGLVSVRPQGRDPVLLGPKRSWQVPTADRVRLSLSKNRPFQPLAVDRSPLAASEIPPSPSEIAFADGWEALRAQHFSDAAAAFERASANAGEQPLIEDAWFWRAVCEARIPRKTAAKLSLAGFIDRFPHSSRIGEVSAMLGWLLLQEGDLEGASRLFASAVDDRVSEVRRSARTGLDAIGRKRGHAAGTVPADPP